MTILASVAEIFSTIGSILLAILVLLVMITIHELGHYIAGKIFKFKINEFAIGMGPAIFKRKNETTGEIFSIRIFPLGGFCAFEGEDDDVDSPNAFNNKKPWQRIIVLVAGATMNFLLGMLILMISVGAYGQTAVETYDIKPSHDVMISQNSLRQNDVIYKINGKNIYMATDISSALKGKKQGDIITVIVKDENGATQTRNVYLRNDPEGENLTDVIPSFTALGVSTIQKVQPTKNSLILENDYLWSINNGADEASGSIIYLPSDLVDYAKSLQVGETAEFYVRRSVDGKNKNVLIAVPINDDISSYSSDAVLSYLGISSTDTYLKYSTKTVRFKFFESIGRGFGYSFNVGGTIFRTLGELLTGKLGLDAMGGPITTITTTSESIRTGGLQYLLDIAGFIGVNLAVFNLLPLPALDGSRVVFCAIEWIRKKPVNRKIEAIIHAVGIVVLLGFSVLVDILQLF